jgi:hypothetical protein
MKRKYFAILLLLLFLIPASEAALLGVNKVEILYSNVLRGGYAEDMVVVSSGSTNNISVYAEARGDIAEWVSFEPADQPFVLSANNPLLIRVIVRPPLDARVGEYEGLVLISTGPLGQQSGQMGTNVVVAFELEVKVSITDTQVLSCGAGGFDIKDIEKGYPLEVSASISNGGNVRIRPIIQLKVYDQTQEKVVSVFNYTSTSEILPTMNGLISAKIEQALSEGQYWVEASVPSCTGGGFLTFSVLEKGGISDIGEFVRLENSAWAQTNEIVPITVSFRNRGSRVVSAQFKGIITLDEKIVKVITSDSVDAAPGELVELQSFFTPEQMGQYRITGRVYYNKKITYEKSTMLNVEQGEAKGQETSSGKKYYLALGVIILIIIVLMSLIIIRKAKLSKKYTTGK